MMSEQGKSAVDNQHLIRRVAWVVALGVLLNPLNSSMIAVATLQIGQAFAIEVATVTWLISGFYLAGAIGPSLAGKLADMLGAKRLFIAGLILVLASSLSALWTSSFGMLLALRVIQALGSAVAFPTGMAMLRSASSALGKQAQSDSVPASLALIAITANVTAAFGPTIGGLLVDVTGWRAIFWINLPLALGVLLLALKWLPAHQPDPNKKAEASLHWSRMDVPGIVLFTLLLTGMIFFLLTLKEGANWLLLLFSLLAGLAFLAWERRAAYPFLDIRMITANRSLQFVYLQYTGVNLIFYSLFFCLPLWLGQVKGYDAKVAGLIMLPLAGLGIVTTALAVKWNKRFGYRSTIIWGNVMLVISTLSLLLLDTNSSLLVIVLISALLGIPNGFNNMGLQTALYEVTDAKDTGLATGLFVTFRSIGSILSTSLLGLVFAGGITSQSLHTLAFVLAAIGGVLLLTGLTRGTFSFRSGFFSSKKKC